ncbi:UDP-glucose 4-epimerase GalE [Amylibacter sp.]|nr:UDP-glucose 4-epimerase GalE [Amylibacter sp.]
MKVLVTGAAGYIGSHACMELLVAGHEVYGVDSLHNGHIEAIDRVKRLSNKPLQFSQLDIRNGNALDNVFKAFMPEVVIHFAGLKAVSESTTAPLEYYSVNVCGSMSLLKAMDRAGCSNIVFSSSATVYGHPDYLPYDELHPTGPVNPYGRTKLMVEEILRDWTAASSSCRSTVLRYFNPVGAHPSGLLGEDPLEIPNNLMPYIAQVAMGKREVLNVFGSDYNTVDGSGVRDYIHVMDLVRAHILAIEQQEKLDQFEVINLGTGFGTSVLELVKTFKVESSSEVPIKFAPRRDGDLASSWANATKAFDKLGWKTVFTIAEMCKHTWAWQLNNKNGYATKSYKKITAKKEM